MIRVVDHVAFHSGIRRKRLLLINQNRVIDAETGVSSKEANKQLSARQSCIQTSVRLLLVPGALLKHHASIADSEVTWPAMSDVFLENFATCLGHLPQILVSRKYGSLIFWQRLCPSRLVCDSANAGSQRRIIQGSALRIEASKLLKLHGGAA